MSRRYPAATADGARGAPSTSDNGINAETLLNSNHRKFAEVPQVGSEPDNPLLAPAWTVTEDEYLAADEITIVVTRRVLPRRY